MIKKLLLIAIIILAAFLRLWKLDIYPALNADEAAIGYNAYSLIETGKDEHGNPWPIHFQSFNDYKPGLYFYMVLPFVKYFGLNEWSVRLPGALTGVASVYLVYLLVNQIFKDRISAGVVSYSRLGLVASLFLTISPWHIHFSRGGWEVNVATFFIILGLYLFSKGRTHLPTLMLSAVSFVLSLYTYHAARIVVPLLGVGLLWANKVSVKDNFKNFLLAGLVLIVSLLPLVKDFTKPEISSRAAGVGLFADPGPLSRINEQRGEHQDFADLFPKIFHNRVVNYGLSFLENWTEHYHGEFLFISGEDIERNKVAETGQTYLYSFILVLLGFAAILRKPKGWGILVWWFMVAPAAAALTFQSPHALRSQNMVIPLEIISAYGLVRLVEWVKDSVRSKSLSYLGFFIIFSIVGLNFSRYLHMYFVHTSKEYPFSSQYGVKELVDYLKSNQGSYQKVLVTDRYDQPYILFLFYLQYNPAKFQEGHELTARDGFGFSTVRNFDKYEFRTINWDYDQPRSRNTLIVGTDEDVPDEANIVKEIYGTNGYKYFEVVAN